MKLNDLSPAALSAAMRGGTDLWGQWGSAGDHVMYVEPVHADQRRRKCRCGCRRWHTHRAMAHGVCLGTGCELSMHRFARGARLSGRAQP
jgi:hypothetical protein